MSTTNEPKSGNPAVDLIRQKLQDLYAGEPAAKEELAGAITSTHRSKHQQFMYNLSNSGRSLADIQTAWHNYYVDLPSAEKHQVWQEFYEQHGNTSPQPVQHGTHKTQATHAKPIKKTAARDARSAADIKKQLLNQIGTRSDRRAGSHLKSLMFGLSCGLAVLIVLTFGFFNERFLAPFITPSKDVSATPIIIDPSGSAVGSEPKIVIPKINVEIPVVYTEPSTDEEAVQRALEQGVLHYATTSKPGELGNGAIFGHSSNNILNKGKYKFAFVLLKRLEVGDTFTLEKDGKRYVYKVFSKKVVKPEDVAVLSDTGGKPATMSLITCDPPGTSINRLVVTGEQISPDPGANAASSTKTTDLPKTLPSNSPSLWSRLTSWLSN